MASLIFTTVLDVMKEASIFCTRIRFVLGLQPLILLTAVDQLSLDGKVAWVNTADNTYISEIVYLQGIKAPTSNESREPMSASNQRESTKRTASSTSSYYGYCSSDNKNILKTACVIAGVGEIACANVLGEYVSASAVSGGGTAALCNVAAQKLTEGEIDPAILGLAALSGAAIGAGDEMLEENRNSLMGSLLKLSGYLGAGYLIYQCIENVERSCY